MGANREDDAAFSLDKPPLSEQIARPGFIGLEVIMVSSTQQFDRIRKRKSTTNGKRNKRDRRRLGTPKFAVHPVGYDATAADARPATAAK